MTNLATTLPWALPWLAPLLSIPRFAARTPSLSTIPPLSGGLLSVIIPARNESLVIGEVLRSVLASRYPDLEVIVVDDRSTDDTAAQVERLAAEDPRLRLIHGTELPNGWYGKPWACVQGYRAAQGQLIVFIDADTRGEPGLFGHAVGMLRAENAGMLSILPFQECLTFWERVIMPQVWYMIGMRFDPVGVNRATRARDLIANGQFILVTRDAYETAGTHEAVRGEVAEDLALAQALFRAGQPVRLAHADDLMTTRMYRSLRELIEGWSKNAYLGGRQSFPDEPILRALVPLLLIAAPLFWLLPPVALLLAIIAGSPSWIGTGLAATAAAALFWMVVSSLMRIPRRYALAYPFGALATLYIFARSLRRGGRRVEWRGRVYGAPEGAA